MGLQATRTAWDDRCTTNRADAIPLRSGTWILVHSLVYIVCIIFMVSGVISALFQKVVIVELVTNARTTAVARFVIFLM